MDPLRVVGLAISLPFRKHRVSTVCATSRVAVVSQPLLGMAPFATARAYSAKHSLLNRRTRARRVLDAGHDRDAQNASRPGGRGGATFTVLLTARRDQPLMQGGACVCAVALPCGSAYAGKESAHSEARARACGRGLSYLNTSGSASPEMIIWVEGPVDLPRCGESDLCGSTTAAENPSCLFRLWRPCRPCRPCRPWSPCRRLCPLTFSRHWRRLSP